MIPHNRPWITPEDRAAVDAVLASGWVAQGPAVGALESFFSQLHGGGAACAVSSGTAALALALQAQGIGKGMKVGVPTYSCSALLNAVHWVGAQPELADVVPGSFVIDASTLPATVDAVIAVHAFGAEAPVAECRQRARIVIEDCCQSLGGMAGSRPLGQAGDAAVYSFYASKIVCAGQGGLVWSADGAVAGSVRDYREFDGREDWKPRFNLQMTDMQAGLAVSQLRRLGDIVARRQATARLYAPAIPSGFTTQAGVTDAGRMAHRYVLVAPDSAARDALAAHMASRGVRCIVPVERFELLHRYLGVDAARFPAAERLVDTTLSLPVFPDLQAEEAAQVAQALGDFRA